MDDANLYLNFSLRKSICPTSLLLSVAATEKKSVITNINPFSKRPKSVGKWRLHCHFSTQVSNIQKEIC